MATFSRTNTFVSGASITASGHNTNWDDITTYINNRYSGIDTWLNMKVSATAANPVDISGSASSTEVSINNSATDGDPLLTFKLGGTQTHVIGVDDSDSDLLKFATTAITTNVAMQIPTTGAQVQFAAGSASAASVAGPFGNAGNGIFFPTASSIGFTTGGTEAARFDSSQRLGLGTTSPSTLLHLSGSANIRLDTTGANSYSVLVAGGGNPRFVIQNNTSSAERIGVDDNGNIILTNAAVATSATDGFVLIGSCAGTPTGVATGVYAGRTPMIYDTTNNKIWFYNGSWRGVTVS